MKIRTKINLSFISVFILILSIVGVVVGIYTTGLVKKNIYSYLSSSNRARAEHIRTFIKQGESTSVILAAASVYRDFLKEPVISKQYPVIKDKIYKRFARTLEAEPDIYETLIIDTSGKIVAASNKEEEGLDKSDDTFFTEAKDNVFLKDVYFSTVINKLTYAISAPIKDDNGKLLGISVLRYLPKNFFSIVENENGLGNTEENFLINKDKFFISPSLFLGEDVILKQKVETQNANSCFDPKEIEYVKKNGYSGLKDYLGGTQIVEALDYRGVDIIGTHSYISETGWCLITKADKADLMSFRGTLIIIFSSIFTFAALLFLLIGLVLSKKITNPLNILRAGVNKIKQGNLDYKVIVKSDDEVGDLSESFNDMVLSVRQSREDVDIKVKEQTKEISNKAKELEDQKTAILNILEDVEKQKKQVEDLANDLEKFKLAVDNASDQAVITDVEGIVIYGNKAIERITGYKAEEAIGKKAGALWKMPMPTEYYKNMWDVIKNQKKVFVGEIQNKRKNGELYIANISISPVLDQDGTIMFFVAIEHDITKEKEIDKAKTEFVSLASHQLRTPLSAINWYTEMLLAGDAGPINEEQKKYLTEVAFGNKRMVDLVDSLLNVSRLDLGTFIIEPEKTNVAKILKSIVGELQSQIKEKKLKVEENYNEDIVEFQADKKLLRIVLQNLLSNAVKYTKNEGEIKINLATLKKGDFFGEREMKEDSLVFSVSDTGIGIVNNQQEKIFLKLFRADNARESETEGTGLGLYIVKSIIDQSGGMVWFKSEEGKGTAFFISLPLSGMKKKEGTKKLD